MLLTLSFACRLWQLREDVVFMNKMSLGVSLLVLTGVLYSYNAVATALTKLR
jgi:hypothetical protein